MQQILHIWYCQKNAYRHKYVLNGPLIILRLSSTYSGNWDDAATKSTRFGIRLHVHNVPQYTSCHLHNLWRL
jgi:hypothetical protein